MRASARQLHRQPVCGHRARRQRRLRPLRARPRRDPRPSSSGRRYGRRAFATRPGPRPRAHARRPAQPAPRRRAATRLADRARAGSRRSGSTSCTRAAGTGEALALRRHERSRAHRLARGDGLGARRRARSSSRPPPSRVRATRSARIPRTCSVRRSTSRARQRPSTSAATPARRPRSTRTPPVPRTRAAASRRLSSEETSRSAFCCSRSWSPRSGERLTR